MKSFLFVVGLLISAVIVATPMAAPEPGSKDEQQLMALVKEVQAQQAQIVDNQAKIEAKLTEVAETIRTARIYSSRGR